MSVLIIEACGPGTSIQDQGRFGYQRFGLGPAGAMDRVSMAEANILVGNGPDTAAVEMAVLGARFRVDGGRMRVALVGAGGVLRVDGVVVPPYTSATVESGQALEIAPVRAGFFMYLAVSGGFDIPPQLGSRALHSRGGVGGLGGRGCRAGDRLPVIDVALQGPDVTAAMVAPSQQVTGPVRVMFGPQLDYFSSAGVTTFLGERYTVTTQTDRMGIRLAGPKIEHSEKGYNIVSDGIATGSVQVPGAGEPLVQLADRGTTGGYPKIATVISADHGRIAQFPAGTKFQFLAVTRAQAVTAVREQAAALEAFKLSLRGAGETDLTSERLLGLNLNEGWGG
ncbi:MAG: biotin-dependent carboxyltransferase family protein [Hyphomicrobiaceae bacterium]|nr:biotin-dependent carboxyltransferase family protein [Hyphomicrobiaceae bacterium]